MPNDPNRSVPPDWHIIKLDERQHWRDDLRAKTKAIYIVKAAHFIMMNILYVFIQKELKRNFQS